MFINMSIVFGVLICLSIMIRLIHLVDTAINKKEEPKKAAPAPKAAAPAAAPVAAAPQADNGAVVAVIAAAVAACENEVRIIAVRPIESTTWKNGARAAALQSRV